MKLILALVLLLSVVFASNAQTQYVDKTKIDSLTFEQTRKQIYGLSNDQFLKGNFDQDSIHIPYRLLLPKDKNANQKYPLVITFHNSTRIGNDNEKQLEALAKIWQRPNIYKQYQCFVLAPQFGERSSSYWLNADSIQVSHPSVAVLALHQLISDLEKQYPEIDRDRIYLIGYSMGGSTSQNLFNSDPNRFAKLVSLASVPDLSNIKAIQNKSIWLIHGKLDTENPYTGSEILYKKLKGNKHLRFTSFDYLNHDNITIPFLLSNEIPKWLFAK